MRIILGAVTFAISFCSCGESVATRGGAAKADNRYDAAFWETWGDGFAEVSIYELQTPRDGEMRDGESIAIFASEKVDSQPAIELRWQRNFQTGISDGSEMSVSTLNLVGGVLAKTSFSRQSWDGHLFREAQFGKGGMALGDGVSEDGLVFWARGMAAPFLAAGESKAVPFLTGLRSAQEAGQPLAWSRIELKRNAVEEKIEVAAGEFEVEIYAAKLGNGKGYTFAVEKAVPHRIVRWQYSSGEVGELYSSERVKYWELKRPGGEEALRSLGLEPRAPRFVPEEP